MPSTGVVSTSNLDALLGCTFLGAIALASKLLPARLVLEGDNAASSDPYRRRRIRNMRPSAHNMCITPRTLRRLANENWFAGSQT